MHPMRIKTRTPVPDCGKRKLTPDHKYDEDDYWHDEGGCLKKKHEKASTAKKKAKDDAAKRAEELEAKRAHEALKADAALSFMLRRNRQSQSGKDAEHLEVIIVALKQYHAGLVAAPQQNRGHKRKEH